MAEPVHLDNIEAFRVALHEYVMSEHAKHVLAESKLVVLSGLAGGGRNSTINYLVEHHNYFFLVSDTTRPPKLRDGVMEQNGVQYHFRQEDNMLSDIQAGEFIEAEIIHNQQVSGTSVRELELANETGRITIHEMEFGGTDYIAGAKSDAYIIGLLPPDYDEWIRRLSGREEMHQQEFINRLQTAEKVLDSMLSKPYFKLVINHTIPQCAADIRSIVEDGKLDDAKQHEARQVATALLEKIRLKLSESEQSA